MARPVQCTNCKNKFDRELLIDYSKTKRLCKKCLSEQRELDDLKAYICNLYKMEYVSPKLQKQINEFINEHKYRPKAIKMIIEYAINIEKFEVDIALESITFVNYFKYSAIKYYTDKKAIQDSVRNAKPPTLHKAYISDKKKSFVPKKRMFNIEDFDVEE